MPSASARSVCGRLQNILRPQPSRRALVTQFIPVYLCSSEASTCSVGDARGGSRCSMCCSHTPHGARRRAALPQRCNLCVSTVRNWSAWFTHPGARPYCGQGHFTASDVRVCDVLHLQSPTAHTSHDMYSCCLCHAAECVLYLVVDGMWRWILGCEHLVSRYHRSRSVQSHPNSAYVAICLLFRCF